MGRQGSRAEVKTSGEESQSTKKEGSTTKTKQIEQIGVCVCAATHSGTSLMFWFIEHTAGRRSLILRRGRLGGWKRPQA